jgi:hypothetical protein
VLRAFKTLDFNGDGILTIADLRDKYNASMHPDVKSGKRTEDEVLTEFLETFELHHNILNGTQADGLITPDEFLEYYSHVSSNIDSDAYFELMMSNAWNLESRNNPNSMPFAGSSKKITKVNAREAYRNDHHRNLFGTDSKTPFDKKAQTEYLTSKSQYPQPDTTQYVPTAGGSNLASSGAQSENPRMAWASKNTRVTPAQYRGI